MRKSEIKFDIELDQQNVPEKIIWDATDNPTGKPENTKAISIALWDGDNKSTMKIDLWVKEMPVDEMKVFYIETLRGMSESVKNATNDEVMYKAMQDLCTSLMDHVKVLHP